MIDLVFKGFHSIKTKRKERSRVSVRVQIDLVLASRVLDVTAGQE